ncbi:MAG TPA: PIN domain-containing protein [Mycobacteriales bacterium]|nr:PIN domain-containing protein [Mycobacteriales bacterium]
MIVVDTSAWVEFLRGTGSATCTAVRSAIATADELAVPDVVRLELLAGAAEADVEDLRRLLARFVALPASSPADHEVAASLYRRARSAGRTVRSLVDCLVAAAALRLDVPVLARDRDYAALAAVSGLRLVPTA